MVKNFPYFLLATIMCTIFSIKTDVTVITADPYGILKTISGKPVSQVCTRFAIFFAIITFILICYMIKKKDIFL